MNKEEKENLKCRIAKADRAENRIRNLQEAIKYIKRKETTYIGVCIADGTILYSSDQKRPNGLGEVCWSKNEEGLGDQLIKSILDLLQSRLIDAQNELEQA